MINARNLIIAMIVGALVAGLIREVNQYGLMLRSWSPQAPRLGEALVTGALVAAVSQLFAQKGARR